MSIRKAIKDSGMSHEEIAERVGVSRVAVNRWYNGTRRELRARDAIKLAKVLKVPVEQLLG